MYRGLFKYLFETINPIATIPMDFIDKNGKIVFIISCTFSMGTMGTRMVELNYDENLTDKYDGIEPKNHIFYHNHCIPFMNQTGIYEGSYNEVKSIVLNLYSVIINERRPGLREFNKNLINIKEKSSINKKEEENSNIISFDKNNKD